MKNLFPSILPTQQEKKEEEKWENEKQDNEDAFFNSVSQVSSWAVSSYTIQRMAKHTDDHRSEGCFTRNINEITC